MTEHPVRQHKEGPTAALRQKKGELE